MDNDAIYKDLMNQKDTHSEEVINGVDGFLTQDRIKVSSLDQLFGFARIAEDTLVHKSKKDLWRIGEDDSGDVIIERLFDPNTKEALKI